MEAFNLNKNFIKDRYGLIFDGSCLVGTFDSFTSEDCFAKRKVEGLSLNVSYFAADDFKTKKPLRFIYASIKDIDQNLFELIDDFGFGTLNNCKSVWFAGEVVLIGNVVWHKCPRPKNEN